MKTTHPLISLKQVSRRYGDQQQWFALQNATLEIGHGEFVAIIGPSGSGKSTLLNTMGLLDETWNGTFEIDGRDVRELNRAERDKLRASMFGFVFQSSYANPYESTARNAALGLAIQGLSLTEQSARVTRALAVVGLLDKADSMSRTLSGGERQRLAIARAIATQPRLILADEPTGNLDSASATRMMELFRELNELGTSIVVVTHDRKVADFAHRIVEVRDGILTEVGAPIPKTKPEHTPAADDLTPAVSPWLRRPRVVGATMRRWPEHAIRAMNNVTSRPMRSAALVAAFTLAIAGMVAAAGIGASASQQIADRLTSAALDEVRVSVTAGTSPDERHNQVQAIGELLHVLGVGELAALDAATARTSRFALSPSVDGQSFSGSTLGVNESLLTLSEVVTVPVNASQFFGSVSSGRVALVGEEVAERLGIRPGGFGSEVWVSGRPYSVVGTITDSPRAPNLVTSVVIPLEELPSPASEIVVRTEPGFSASVAEAIPLALSPSAPADVAVSTTGDLRNLRVGVSADLDGLLNSISVALLALAVLSASSAMFLSVHSRTQELALSRALGLSQTGVATIFIWEGIIVGFAGSLAGVSLGLTVAVGVAAARDWTAAVPWSALALAPLVGIIGGAVSAFLPALRAARIDPADAIR
ncbi:ABC transporter ATP-binding protein/permease [Cryobacterium sp. PH31-O1]|uniref:ABC transporter ATP-binding protein/permease n=1 Tax=Cryobacterium sp. PH31-O1 TaxID=3046306 RepID=UPI0024BBDA55|nr:ABC transporter ATP-binding protein/permease [Cryobacterium sp. PH31-O1]MDJ0336749.1 ATP-binding cassette domain-containing protein [Cryobacterium sp. PH31-O1]